MLIVREASVDVGGGFDLMDEHSHHNAPGLMAQQQRNRRVLCAIMAYAGFAPLPADEGAAPGQLFRF